MQKFSSSEVMCEYLHIEYLNTRTQRLVHVLYFDTHVLS